jgi:hypothetical protein
VNAAKKLAPTGGSSLFNREPDRSRRKQSGSVAARRIEAETFGKNTSVQYRINIFA